MISTLRVSLLLLIGASSKRQATCCVMLLPCMWWLVTSSTWWMKLEQRACRSRVMHSSMWNGKSCGMSACTTLFPHLCYGIINLLFSTVKIFQGISTCTSIRVQFENIVLKISRLEILHRRFCLKA